MNRVRRGDMVEVIAGKEKGKRGRIVRVLREKNRVVVERLMMVKKHVKPSQKNPQGGIIEQEGSIHVSNVMPIDDKTGKTTRVFAKITKTDKTRIGKSGESLKN